MGALLAKLPGGSAHPPQVPRPGGPPREQPEAASPTRRRLAFAVDAVLHAYSQVVFSHSKPIGVALLLASFVVPDVGAVGLLGVVLACALALLMQMDREAVRSGVLGYNALLVFLAIGAMFDRSPTFWGLAAVTAMAVVLFHVALSGALAYHFRLPVLSLPFVAVTWTIMAASPHIRGMAFHGHPPALDFGPFPGPELVDSFLRSLGAIFFQPHWTAGLIVFGALFAYSRIASVHALVGFAMAVAADTWLFTFPPDYLHLYVGFNFIVAAIALGGIYYVPSPASLLLAAGGSLATGLVSVGLLTVLAPVGLPVLAMPFNIALLVVLYALGQRKHDASPRPVAFMAGSPEANLDWYRTRVRRFQSTVSVPLQLPFQGTWICTQGHDGAHTHQGLWRHGLDFEVADADGHRGRGTGQLLTDYYCYRLPVLSPAAGTVVRVIDGIPDNAVGQVDTHHNWGNLVLIQHGPELYSMVAHLSPGSLAVTEGQHVAAGQLVGLCGSSGRSPIPHLHFQLQTTPFIGDQTTEVSFSGVVVDEGDRLDLRAHHLPDEGQRVRNAVRKADLAERIAMPPGRRHRYEVTDGEETLVQELVSEIDPLGNRSLHDPATGARLWFNDAGTGFVVYDYTGPRSGALLAMYCGMLRIPFDEGFGMAWCDVLAPHRHTWTVRSFLLDGLAAFVTPPDQKMRFSLRQGSEGHVVTGRSEPMPGVPDIQTRACFHAQGLDELEVHIGTRRILVRAVPVDA